MKKHILIFTMLALPVLGIAQTLTPEWVKNIYGLNVSPNGRYIASMAGNASIYDIQTGEETKYETSFFGLGNPIANNGVGVGNSSDVAIVMINGEEHIPSLLGPDKFWYGDISAITPDGEYVCGMVSNPEKTGADYVPFVAKLESNGEVSGVTMLPVPERDFTNTVPQWISALCISDDGKTIAGQVLINNGHYMYPIVFTQDSDGKWTYSTPSLALFNPDDIQMPENPYSYEPKFPEPEDYLEGLDLQAYQQAYTAWMDGGMVGDQPVPETYMTDEQYEAYAAAVETYNEWYNSTEEQRAAYDKAFYEMLATTPEFSQNEMAISPDGKNLATRGVLADNDGNYTSAIYLFDIASGGYKKIETPDNDYFPKQILPGGLMLATKGQMEIPNAIILKPGETEWISMQEYFIERGYSGIAEYLNELCPRGTGVVTMDYEQTTVVGALYAAQMADYDWDAEYNDYFFSTYIVTGLPSGIEKILAEPENGVYRVYNLQGVKVLETKDASAVDGLSKGIYIVNGKKVFLK